MRFLLLCAFILTGCGAPRQQYSTEAVAERKQHEHAELAKQKERDHQALRLSTRQLYVQDHPELTPGIRKAILNEQIKVGMTGWQVVAAYSLWEYAPGPGVAKYQEIGAMPLWTLADRNQSSTAKPAQERWVLKRKNTTQYLTFEDGALTKLND